MTSSEFKERLESKDIKCMLADMLASNVIHHTSLKNASYQTRVRFLDKAEELLKKLDKFGLKLVTKD